MMPRQVRPTAKGSSSDMRYVCSTGRPLARTSPASSYTAPSTQPPETLHTTSPSGATAIAAPGSLGALLNVRTTVARPNVSPSSHDLEIGSRMSRTFVTSAVRGMTSDYVPGRPDAIRQRAGRPRPVLAASLIGRRACGYRGARGELTSPWPLTGGPQADPARGCLPWALAPILDRAARAPAAHCRRAPHSCRLAAQPLS